MKKPAITLKLKSVTVRLAAPIAEPLGVVTGPADVARVARELIGMSDREQIVVFHLNAKNEVVSFEVVSTGTLTASLAHPREIFKAAILRNAAAIVMAHNHPSGSLRPSPDDVAITDRIRSAGELLGIELLDHVIVGPTGFTSMQGGSA